MTDKKRFTPRPPGQKQEKHFLEAQPARDTQAVILPLGAIVVPANIRSELIGIEELAASIKENGLLAPLVVSKVDGRFELVAGQRRYAALKALKQESAPVRILNVSADQVAVLRLIENLQREDLNGSDEVRAVAKLLPIFEGNQSAVARAIGKGQPYVNQCIRAAKYLTDHPTYSAPNSMSKTMLFSLANSKEPDQLAEKIEQGEVKTTREAREKGRKPSGPVVGGRFGAEGAVQLRERQDGKGFSLRLNWDKERTPADSVAKIISTLEAILLKLRSPKS